MYTGNDRWGGGSDAAVEGEWRWRSDGVLFSNWSKLLTGIVQWCPGEPSNGAEHCLLMNFCAGNKNNDGGCGSPSKYLCEHPRTTISSYYLSVIHFLVNIFLL